MRLTRAIGLLRSVVASLVIIALMAGSATFPAMAAGTSPDCMGMMQSDDAAPMTQSDTGAPMKTPDACKICPFAALCATAGFFVDPAPGELFPVRYPIEVANFAFHEDFDDGLPPRPPARPPRI